MSRIVNDRPVRQREPRARDAGHMARIARLPCIACAVRQGIIRRGVHVAHVRTEYPEPGWREVGKAEKPSDFRTLPLCPAHHMDGPDAQHRANERDWYEEMHVYPPELCAQLAAAFARGESGEKALLAYASRARGACAASRSAP